ncbi:MAG: Stf0 sulfotransferase family protein, partial [Gemmatimonadetes bacterium]|nr:Stf0 sulfotransferase family protein [Gemmatimonadota bacterium]
ALKGHRTFENGVLGINLHGEHLYDFVPFERHLERIPTDYLMVIRRDQIAQAVSYEIAMQAQQWSTKFKKQRTPEYDFEGIEKRLRSIQNQNALISAFVNVRSSSVDVICYEDLLEDAGLAFGRVACLRGYDIEHARPTVLKRQSDSVNEEWIAHFSEEYFEKRARI